MLADLKPDNSHFDFAETNLIVIMSRRQNRLIVNEVALAQKLSEEFGLQTVFLRNEDQSFEEMISILRMARVVVGMHGSILVMAMFCRRGTVMIEMYPYAIPGDNYTPYKTMASLPGMDLVYRSWINKNPELSIPHPDRHQLYGGLRHLSDKERQNVIDTLTVPQHLCCSSPYWLYRIYQDTIITIPEILNLVKEALVESRMKLKDIRTREWGDVALLPHEPKNVACIDHEAQEHKGQLWVTWDRPWTGVKVDKWNIVVQNTGKEFDSEFNSTSAVIPGFLVGETARIYVRAYSLNVWSSWGHVVCSVK